MKSKKDTEQSSLNIARYIAAAVSLFGLSIMAYLTKIHYESTEGYFCDISGDISCSQVAQSAYSEIFGIPVAILGLGYFAFNLLLMLLRRNKEVFQLIFFVTLFVLIPSLYLSAVELFEIKVICVLCEASKVLMIAILAISLVVMKQNTVEILRKSIPVIIAGVIAAGITYLIQNRGG